MSLTIICPTWSDEHWSKDNTLREGIAMKKTTKHLKKLKRNMQQGMSEGFNRPTYKIFDNDPLIRGFLMHVDCEGFLGDLLRCSCWISVDTQARTKVSCKFKKQQLYFLALSLNIFPNQRQNSSFFMCCTPSKTSCFWKTA